MGKALELFSIVWIVFGHLELRGFGFGFNNIESNMGHSLSGEDIAP